ncbi:MAG: laccase domain-containing protein, partial [Erysipelotrichales bacterium]
MYQVIRDDSILAISTNRSDGVSKAPYDSLNLAYHVLDNKDDVDTNYSLLANKLNIDVNDIYIPNQTHSKIMLEVKKNQTKITNECDALYTKDKGVYIGVLTADCLPILMYAHDKEVVVAIHAGWQGSDKLIVQEC